MTLEGWKLLSACLQELGAGLIIGSPDHLLLCLTNTTQEMNILPCHGFNRLPRVDLVLDPRI